jgi:hypothetical protein
VVGTADEVALGLPVWTEFDVHRPGRGRAERGIVQGVHSQDFQRKQRTQLLQVDVCRKV